MLVLCACGSTDNQNNTLADNTPQDIQEEEKQQDDGRYHSHFGKFHKMQVLKA